MLYAGKCGRCCLAIETNTPTLENVAPSYLLHSKALPYRQKAE